MILARYGKRCLNVYCVLVVSKVKVPLTTTYEDVVADDEHSDTDDENQNTEYHECHSAVHSIVTKIDRCVY